MSEEDEDELDPRFCSFCQDQMPVGKMLVVLEGTQTLVARTEFKVCGRCSTHYTDVKVGTNEEGEVAVFQFEHDAFHSEETQKTLVSLTRQFENQFCHVCDKTLPLDEDAPSAKDFATKVLRMHPEGDNVVFTCESCATLGLCECCNEEDEG
jgi:ribosomal protein L31